MDGWYLGLIALLTALTWAGIHLCSRLAGRS